MERLLIAIFETRDKKFGYNMTAGGDGMFDPTSEVRAKMSKASRGRVVSQESRDAISRANKGRTSNRKGVKLSKETRQKISDVQIGRVAWNKGAKTGKPSWNKGKAFGAETRKLMSMAKKGKPAWNSGVKADTTDDLALANRVVTGDVGAINQFLTLYIDSVRRACLRFEKDTDRLSLLADTVMRLIIQEKCTQYSGSSTLTRWVYSRAYKLAKTRSVGVRFPWIIG